MKKILWRSPDFFLTWALFLLFMTMGCGSLTDNDNDEPPIDKDFSGSWRISEELTDCEGDVLKIEYTAEIMQDGTDAQLQIGDDTMACKVSGDVLSCTGKLQLGNDSYRVFEEILFWFDEDAELDGSATWRLYGSDNPGCLGSSVFSISHLTPDATNDYNGMWNIREKWNGCSKAGVIDYTISIKKSDTGANLFIGNRSLDCTINEDILNCSGERHYENGTYDNFSEYILWFNEQDQLEGEGRWTYYNAEGEDCSGTSVFSLNEPESDSQNVSNSDDLDGISFEGVYRLFLNIDDCRGYRTAEEAETYIIFQNGTNATFTSAEDPAFSFDCQIIRGELQCAGENIIMADSDATWEITQMTFSYDSRNELTGIATGITYEADGNECPGTYYFSTISSLSGPTASFNGTWNVTESMLGCTTSITASYPIEIIENDTGATIDVQGEVFDCTIENNELICSGAFHGGSGAHFEYSEYRLWFNDNNLLDGIARWTFFEGPNPVCDGNSTISTTSTVSSSRSFNEASKNGMRQSLLMDRLQYGAKSLQ